MARRNAARADAAKREEALQQTMKRLEEGIRNLFDSERYLEYLTVMSRFHSYSFNNCMLIALQRPDATLVAGYRAWQDKFGRQVRKGEHGIKILSPVLVKARGGDGDRDESDNADEEPKRRLAGFRLATVFDVSQTEGKELPSLGANELEGDVGRFDAAMDAIAKVSKYPVEFEDVPGGAKGFFSHAEPKRIVIQKGMPQAQTLKTAVHELAHSVMHDFDPKDEGLRRPDRATREVQAESVAFVVSSWLGLDTGDYSFGYIASWSSGREAEELKASLDGIRQASHGIIDGIEAEMAKTADASRMGRSRQVAKEPDPTRRSLTERTGTARSAAARESGASRPARDER